VESGPGTEKQSRGKKDDDVGTFQSVPPTTVRPAPRERESGCQRNLFPQTGDGLCPLFKKGCIRSRIGGGPRITNASKNTYLGKERAKRTAPVQGEAKAHRETEGSSRVMHH